jgi:hypothetical protein
VKVLLVNDTRTSENWGCRATTTALARSLEVAGHQIQGVVSLAVLDPPVHPLADGWLLANRSRARGKTAAALFARASSRVERLDLTPRTPDQVRQFADETLAGKGRFAASLPALERSDAVVINGEGSLYDDHPKGLLLFPWIELALRQGCSVHLVNHTLQLAGPAMRALAAEYGPKLTTIMCREQSSVAEWASVGVTATFAADAAFAYAPADRDALVAVHRPGYYDVWPDRTLDFTPERPYVCLGGSSVFQRADRGDVDPREDYRWLSEHLGKVVDQVVLIAACEKDAALFRPIAEDLGLPLIGARTPTQQAVDILANADALVSGRWHPTILASTGGTPFVMIEGNTNKCQDIYDLFDVDEAIVPAADLHARRGELVERVEARIGAPGTRDRIRSRAAELRTSAVANGLPSA